ncbi:DUF5106 domain-containing protein [Bacteroides sp. 51]|uniref:DUF5106 domain-containing protein n=1 Tax=Bacteroides sp. 51 TaxID=2302938 RepID=UPI0013D4E465|nr:DUF5106 domain-containing protein [Bacteroides sp. 51]NDV81517.1 DUF5106 domain-containing protein [Bacteroides sp. 51]
MKLFYYLAAALIICTSCNSGNSSKEKLATEETQETPKKITLPEIPTMYTSSEQRADFLVKHYWDNFDFTDTSYIHLPEVTEQAYVDFLDVINHSPMESAFEGMKRLMTHAEKDKKVFDYFVSLSDKYLYDPNSPFRSEELYIVVLEKMMETNLLDDTEKTRPNYRLQLAQKNRLGTKALNFTYTMQSGKQGTLYGVNTEYTLLYINNPGCSACGEITEGMRNSQIIQYLLSGKRMTILCVYPDEDLEEWKKHQNDFPSDWINGYDKGTVMRDKNLYDLKAIPSIYLLDKNKTVLLKDATFTQLEQYLNNNLY